MANKNTWIKWFTQAWLSDANLRMTSLASHGLWMSMICFMNDSSRPGFLIINGKKVGANELSMILGRQRREVETLLGELEDAGVFSRDEEGVIYCRRMLRDLEKQQLGRIHGKKGGNPKLKTPLSLTLNPPSYPSPLTPDLTHPLKLEEEEDAEEEAEADSAGLGPLTLQAAAGRLGKIFGRPVSSRWSNVEEYALSQAMPISKEDLALVEWRYAQFEPERGQIDSRRHKLLTMLENWPSEVDLAREFSRTHPIHGNSNFEKKNKGGVEEPARELWVAWLSENYPKAEAPETFAALPSEIRNEYLQNVQSPLVQ